MNNILLLIITITLSACSVILTQVHTDGNASDIVDDNDAPELSPRVDFPNGIL